MDGGAKFGVEVNNRSGHGADRDAPPQGAVPITGAVPDPAKFAGGQEGGHRARALVLTPNTPMGEVKTDQIFSGSCTSSHIADLRAVAKIVLAVGPRARRPWGVRDDRPWLGPCQVAGGGGGLDAAFKGAGFDWREAGCPMCRGMNEG